MENQNYDNEQQGWQTGSEQQNSLPDSTGQETANNNSQQEWQFSENQQGWQPVNNAGPGNGYQNYVPEPEEGPGFAIAGMVCGILSIICCCVWYVGLVLAVVGMVLSILALKQHKPGRGMAIAGIICSAIGLGIGLLMGISSIIMMLNPEYQTNLMNNFYRQYGSGRYYYPE